MIAYFAMNKKFVKNSTVDGKIPTNTFYCHLYVFQHNYKKCHVVHRVMPTWDFA